MIVATFISCFSARFIIFILFSTPKKNELEKNRLPLVKNIPFNKNSSWT